MSKLDNMSLKDIIEQIDLLLKENDIMFFSNSKEVIEEFNIKFKGRSIRREALEKFLVDNEAYIDKENFVLLVALNYMESIQELENRKASLSQKAFEDDIYVKLANIEIKLKGHKEKLAAARRIGKDIKKYITVYYHDREQNRGRVYVLDSRQIIEGKKSNNQKSLKKFDKLDQAFMIDSEENNLGLEYVIQILLLSDLRVVFPDEIFGENVRTMILENEAVKKRN